MSQRLLFVIRGKLGDTLVCHATVQAWHNAHPDDKITVFTRRDYARLLEGEQDIQVIGFGSRAGMILRLLVWRWTRPAFDALLVLWGFGQPIRWIGRLVRARRKCYLDGRFSPLFDRWPETVEFAQFASRAEPAWRIAALLDPDLPRPGRVDLPRLRALRAERCRNDAPVGLVPLADEPRRCLDASALQQSLDWMATRYPGKARWLIVNPHDTGASELLADGLPAGVEVRRFASLDELVAIMAELGAWVGTDTGLFHLAAAMGVPTTVFFGPTEPLKVVLPAQPSATGIRLAALGNEHCEITDCRRPLCLHAAVANAAGVACATVLAETPSACPLRTLPAAAINENKTYENPRHQA